MAVRRKIAGPGRLGSIKAAKNSVKKSGNALIRNIPKEGITVRFLEEPSEWFGYYEYYDESRKNYFPVIEGEDTPEGASVSFRYLANAYVVDDSDVRAVKMPKSAVEQLIARYEKHGTVMDRDYELSRTGSGKNDTKYMVSPDSPAKMNLSRFKLIDLAEVLESLIVAEDDDDDDDEDESPSPMRTRRSTPKRSSRDIEDDEDEDYEDDEEDDEDDEDEPPARRRPVKKTSTTRKPVRKPIRKTRR